MKNWYTIQAKGKAAEILIYDEIGMFGIAAAKFIGDLKALGKVEEITLGVNSPGGDVFDGIAIYNALKRHGASIVSRVDGIAASIASLILMAGNTIVMPDNAMLMIHNPWGGALGEADDMREVADALDKIKIAMIAAYRRSGKSDEAIAAIMDEETWYTADEAKANGFADEVIQSVNIAAFFDLKKFQKAPEALRARPAAPAADPKDEGSRAREIAEACAKAGVPAAVAFYIDTPWSSAEVAARLEHAPAIRAVCKEYGAERLADHYVTFGFHPDHVKAQLEELHRVRLESDTRSTAAGF